MLTLFDVLPPYSCILNLLSDIYPFLFGCLEGNASL